MKTMKKSSMVLAVILATGAAPAQAGGGTLDKDAIRKVVRAHIDEVRACYNEGLKRDPELAGRIVLEFVIAAEGAVSQVKIAETTVPDAQMGACVVSAAQTWVFPAPAGGSMSVTYPIVFAI